MIVWDECTMAHKRSLKDQSIFCGGAMILLSCYFRQTLPLVSIIDDEQKVYIKSSNLCRRVKALRWTISMQLFFNKIEIQMYFRGNCWTLVLRKS